MQKTKLWLLSQFKGIYLVLLALIIVGFNFVLNDALHQKIHRSGQLLVKQVFELKIDTSINNHVLMELVKSHGFMLKSDLLAKRLAHFINLEREVFNYKTVSLNLYHSPTWIMESYLFILLNLVVLGAASWFYRWWSMLKTSDISAFKNTPISANRRVKQQTQAHLIKPVKTCELSSLYGVAPVYHNLFALIECDCKFDKHTDKEASFKVIIAKDFSELSAVSVKLLNSNYLAITLANVATTELDLYIERLHQHIFIACQNHQSNISRKHIKIGVCNYRLGAEQAMVYQLANSALIASQKNVLRHCHRLSLSSRYEKVLSSEQLIESIKKNKFILFFQPLFDLNSGEILQHEALIRVRHDIHGLLGARYFINNDFSDQDALILDNAVLTQVEKLLSSEPSSSIVSINLHPKNWFNKGFWQWFTPQVSDFKHRSKLQFEISEANFFAHTDALKDVFDIINEGRSHIVIDNVKSSGNIAKLLHYQQVCGLKLAYELVHGINEKTQHQIQIKKIVDACNLLNIPVFATGVETQKELFMLTKLGVAGAQGFYFSEPLQALNQAAFH
jgi:EAL domain-containing protein (putative c-di-GMP-specific phosphodiesterase class I)